MIASTTAIKMKEPWLPSTLPLCPEPTRTVMDDGETHVVPYPYTGATCVRETTAIQIDSQISIEDDKIKAGGIS